MESRPLRKSAVVFGGLLIAVIAGVLSFLTWADHNLSEQSIVTVLIAVLGLAGAYGVALTKLVEGAPPPDPQVPADLHAKLIDKIKD